MHPMEGETSSIQAPRRGLSGLQVFLIVLLTVMVTIAATLWIARTYIFPAEFEPVRLTAREEQTLDTKLERLQSLDSKTGPRDRSRMGRHKDNPTSTPEVLTPEAYSEEGAKRTISLSERELNALLAKNTDLARKLAIDLSDDLVSAKLLVPVDPDFPVLGGKTLKVRAGMELAFREQRPIVILKGISIMGVPLPNAWMGGLKNIDLVEQYGTQAGFWKGFSEGVRDIRISDGQLFIELNE